MLLETVTYEYNLQNRLWRVTTDDTGATDAVVEYTYNEAVIKVKAYSYDTPDGGETKQNEATKIFLIDSYNHTGYAQVLEEWSPSGSHPDVTYTIGDDVITQSATSSSPEHLIYDGHGSVRQHADSSGSALVYQYDPDGTGGEPSVDYTGFDYDAYGMALTPLPFDGLYYTGEYFDTDVQQYLNDGKRSVLVSVYRQQKSVVYAEPFFAIGSPDS